MKPKATPSVFLAVLLLAAAMLVPARPAQAQEQAPTALTGTLAKARETGAITIGYRESSVPFSYLNARKEPIGYSIELCRKLVELLGGRITAAVDDGQFVATVILSDTSEIAVDDPRPSA